MWFERNVMYSVCILYDLSVLAVSRMSFQKKKLNRGVGVWVELYPIFLGFLEFFKLCKAPKPGKSMRCQLVPWCNG